MPGLKAALESTNRWMRLVHTSFQPALPHGSGLGPGGGYPVSQSKAGGRTAGSGLSLAFLVPTTPWSHRAESPPLVEATSAFQNLPEG